jgi:ABC-2 type transport system permease protein
MLADAWIVMLKEWREVLFRGMGAKGSVGFFGLIVVVFGIAIPWRSGAFWVTIPWSAITWAWLPLMLVMAVVADSFAGERERHTLETLLASRLSDASILLGKVAAAVVFAWGMLLLVAVMSLATVNISVMRRDPWTHLLLWRWEETFGVVVLGLLFTVLCATIGVMVSLRSETVRQANLRLSMGLILFFPAVLLALAGIYSVLPAAMQLTLLDWVQTWQSGPVMFVITAVLIGIDAVLLWLSSRMFVRNQLMLD